MKTIVFLLLMAIVQAATRDPDPVPIPNRRPMPPREFPEDIKPQQPQQQPQKHRYHQTRYDNPQRAEEQPIKTYTQLIEQSLSRPVKMQDGAPIPHSGCEVTPVRRRWPFATLFEPGEMLRVYVNTRDSHLHGGDALKMMRMLKVAYDTWRTVPGVYLPELDLQEDNDQMPSSHHSHKHPQRDQRNEISFGHTSAQKTPWVGETWIWVSPVDRSMIQEVDHVFDSRHAWVLSETAQRGDPDHWHKTHMREIDFRHAAVTFWGTFLGLSHSTDPHHSMCSLSNRGELHKISLHCSDRATIASAYSTPLATTTKTTTTTTTTIPIQQEEEEKDTIRLS